MIVLFNFIVLKYNVSKNFILEDCILFKDYVKYVKKYNKKFCDVNFFKYF